MDVVLLARIQFALTIYFHFIYPPITIGLGVLLVIIGWMKLRTNEPIYDRLSKFWTKIFAINFSVGVATGIVMEFEFGTNWSNYARYVGDIFGSPLAAEALFAFFMESVFLGVMIFGRNKVSPKTYFFSSFMVALGAALSAFWIIVANSWMQTPAGYELVPPDAPTKAVITDFWAAVFNPSTLQRYVHVIFAAWLTGGFFALSGSAYYLIKKRDMEFAKKSFKISLWFVAIMSLLQLVTGHWSADGVADHQPTKLAAFEGHYKTGPADLYLFGWVDEANQKVYGIKLPGFTSFLVDWDFASPLPGLDKTDKKDWPPVQVVFQVYHLMVAMGMLMILVSWLGIYYLYKGTLYDKKWFLKLSLVMFLAPQLANMFGWSAAEIGRQPWAVYGILRTSDAISPVVESGQIWFSLILFTLIYLLIGAIYVYLVVKEIKKGPEEDSGAATA